MHYPPILKSNVQKNKMNEFIKVLKKYNIKKCYYGHLHGQSHKDAVVGIIDGIEYKLISADYLNFDLQLVWVKNIDFRACNICNLWYNNMAICTNEKKLNENK